LQQKDAARQLFVWAKKCTSEEEEQQAKSRRYQTILHKQSVNNPIIVKKSIMQSNNYSQKHGNKMPYLKQRGRGGQADFFISALTNVMRTFVGGFAQPN
jgi:hypothetical protein